MSQKNTTPIASEYVLGRGKLYFSEIGSDGLPVGFRFVGNVPEITATVDSENYEHYDSTSTVTNKDLDILIQQSLNWTAVLESMNKENLALFFSANEDAAHVNPSITGFSGVSLVADGNMESEATGGLWYQVQDASNEPALGLTATNALSLETTNASPVALVEDTDYVVDSVTGKVFFLDSSAIQTVITNGEGVKATVTADASASTVAKLEALASGEQNLAVRFELLNKQSSDVELVFMIHKAGVSPNGDMGLISDEAAQMPVTIAVEQNDAFDNPMDVYDMR